MKKFTLQLFLAVVLVVGASLQLKAATVTWNGGASTSNWTNALNWSTDALLTMSDDLDLNEATVILTTNVNTTNEVEVLADSVDITFLVNTASITVDPTGLYIGGGSGFGGPSDNLMTDANNDGVWEITLRRPKGFSSDYIFLNGNSGWGAKESLGGLPCAVGQWNDRYLPATGIWSDTTLLTCYETCATDTICVIAPVLAKPDLPITFEGSATIDYKIVDFGNTSSSIVVDPTDPNNHVVSTNKATGANTWAGTIVGDNSLANPIPFTMTNTKLSVRVWSPDANIPVRLKVENTANGMISVETEDTTTTSGQWETLVFDLANQVTGSALDINNVYDKIVIFFDFNTAGGNKTYYWDDVMMAVPAPAGLTKDLKLTALFDGPISGSPKGIEVYVVNNIADLSTFGVGTANNGGGTDGQEYTFPAVSANAGDILYVANDTAQFFSFFGIHADFQDAPSGSQAMNFNGNDAVELYEQGQIIDIYGDPNVNGTNTPWDYVDTWVYRNCSTGPDSTVFQIGNWTIAPKNNFDNQTTNAGSPVPMPIGTYSLICPPAPDSVDITFLVNSANIPTVDPTGLFIAGGLHFGTPGDNPMTDVNNDGVWEITVRKPKGFTSDYTFTNGNSGWGAKEDIIGQSCAVAPYDDRNLPGVWSDTTLLTCFGSCVTDTVCPAPPAMVDLTFTVDMSQYTGTFTGVNIFGTFNGWSNTSNVLADQGSGLWSGTITVNENDSLEYKFVFDNNGTLGDETLTVGLPCTKTSGNFTNRFLAYGNMNMTVDTVCWNSCMACPVTPPPAPDSVDITFLVNSANIPTVDPTGLFIAGGLHFGTPGDNPMTDVNNDGVWEITVRKPKGFTSDYTFTNGNSGWGAKEDIIGQSCAVAPYDDRNLPGVWSDTTLLTCFGSCVTDTVCPAPPAMVDLTFTVDMSQYGSAFTDVYIFGNFNGWSATSNILTDQGNGLWSGTLTVAENDSMEYKFHVEGSAATEPLMSGMPCTKTSGNFTNRFLAYGNMNMTVDTVCWNSCMACSPIPVDSVDVTFLVNTANITVDPTGMYIAGGAAFGNPGDNPMTDTNNDGIWEFTTRQPEGFTSDYTFTNGNSGWGAKEDITGQPCAVAPFDDRRLPNVWSDTTLLTCFAVCTGDTACPILLARPDLPITFEDTMTIDYAIADFGGNSSFLIVDPTDPNNTVVESTKADSSETWAGTVVGDAGLVNPIPFTASDTMMSVRVWSPDANIPVRFKLENANGGPTVETETMTTVAGQWETLVFNLKNEVVGTPALNLANTYDKVVIFFDFGTAGTGKTYYWDDVMMHDGSVSTNDIAVTAAFEMMPNPANNYVQLQFNEEYISVEKTILMYNSVGQLISNHTANNTNTYTINTNRLSTGMYFISVKTKEGVQTKRLMIAH